MTIDSHMHFWDPAQRDYGWLTANMPHLYRRFMPETFRRPADLQFAVVAVQAMESEEETDALLRLAHETAWIAGVVGWVDFAGPAVAARLSARSTDPLFVGVRPMLQHMPERRWIVDPVCRPALTALCDFGLTFDALVLADQLSAVADLAALFPELSIVLDHAGKPTISPEGPAPDWVAGIGRVASYPNVSCKLSGLLTEAPAGAAATMVKPYVQRLLSEFGDERLMWGSDWPVLSQVAPYEDWLSMARSLVPASSQHLVFGENAKRIYQLTTTKRTMEQ